MSLFSRTLISYNADRFTYEKAVQRLVDGFSPIPVSWMKALTSSRQDPLLFPTCRLLFMPFELRDEAGIRSLLHEVECAGDDDLYELRDAGWSAIRGTKFLAISIEGQLLLGLYGCHSDFYIDHWSELYDSLGYDWHAVSRD